MSRNDRLDIAVSAMTARDLDAVLALWGQTSGVGLNESDTPDQLRAYLDRNPGLSLIARDGTRLVAAVLCGHDGRRGYLNHLAVLPEYRGRGLGRQMVVSEPKPGPQAGRSGHYGGQGNRLRENAIGQSNFVDRSGGIVSILGVRRDFALPI